MSSFSVVGFAVVTVMRCPRTNPIPIPGCSVEGSKERLEAKAQNRKFVEEETDKLNTVSPNSRLAVSPQG